MGIGSGLRFFVHGYVDHPMSVTFDGTDTIASLDVRGSKEICPHAPSRKPRKRDTSTYTETVTDNVTTLDCCARDLCDSGTPDE